MMTHRCLFPRKPKLPVEDSWVIPEKNVDCLKWKLYGTVTKTFEWKEFMSPLKTVCTRKWYNKDMTQKSICNNSLNLLVWLTPQNIKTNHLKST